MLIILPFKDKITFLAILIGEVFTLEVTILSLIFIENFEKELVEIVSDIIIYSILTMISFQFLISLYQLYNPIKLLIQKLFNRKIHLDSPHNTTAVCPAITSSASLDTKFNEKDLSISHLD